MVNKVDIITAAMNYIADNLSVDFAGPFDIDTGDFIRDETRFFYYIIGDFLKIIYDVDDLENFELKSIRYYVEILDDEKYDRFILKTNLFLYSQNNKN